jgi:dTDP-4-dehydrorhamnose reductase
LKQHVLITGGSGLLALNWAAVMRDRFVITLGLHKRRVTMRSVKTEIVSLDSVSDVSKCLETLSPTLVIHTAGLTDIEACEAEPDLAHKVNVALARNVAAACAKHDTRLVHISTDHLTRGDSRSINETAPVEPVNVYARTKADGEVAVLAEKPDALVVRTNFYGWGPSYRPSFSDRIIRALRSDQPISLFTDVFYTPILAEAAIRSVHELLDRRGAGVFNVTGDERISKYGFGLKIAAHFKLDPRLIKPGRLADHPSLARRPKDMSLSNAKACAAVARSLGGVDEHLMMLRRQEDQGLASELQLI